MEKLKVLVADDEEEIRDIISFFVEAQLKCDVTTASDGKEAIDLLSDQQFDLIICDYNMPGKNGGHVYEHILTSGSPLKYVMCSSDSPDMHSIFQKKDCFFGYIQKPNIMGGLKELIPRLLETKSAEQVSSEQVYTPIGVKLLMRLSKLPADIYLRLTEEKYIKVLPAGSNFDETDYLKYEQKGIVHLYTLNFTVNNILQKIDQMISQMTGEPTFKNNIHAVAQVQDLIVSSIRDYGFREELIPSLEVQIKESMDICDSNDVLKLLMDKMLKMKAAYAGKHSFMLAAVSVAIAKKTEWTSYTTAQKLVISSLFHDVFLKEGHANETQTLKEKKYDFDFISHPKRAAELIDKLPNIPPDTSRIILEQHEIGEGIGVPRSIPIFEISPLGQLFTFSHFLVDTILEHGESGKVDKKAVMAKMELVAQSSAKYKKFLSILKELDLF
jgi:CheY-like chemotaxis protein